MSLNNIKLDYEYKILILGDAGVGKTSLLIRYIDDKFEAKGLATLGVDVRYKLITMDNKKIRLDIWDTAGQERFKNIAKNYFKGAHGVIFVFDVNKKKSTEKLKFWLDNANENASKDLVKAMVGNKIDIQGNREVELDQMKSLGNKFNMEVFEASAKDGTGVHEIFTYLVTNLIKNPDIGIYEDDESRVSRLQTLNKNKFKKRKNKECNC